ncbi:DUF86 domain-containing protein [Geminocystis sp. CENA526]|uniref:HepT-like ribonuclease domain-containing protein n=1 Tax=Geminocystis sp. CENA526 TaxID=1355871 RepID=UPI003D6F8D18
MKTNQVYLIHIRDCLARIEDYTKEGKEFFFKDLKTQDAVIRNLEVMAESIKKLPDEWKQDFKEISWGEITGFRNRLAHEYLGIDIEIVWEIIEVFLPPLTEAITEMTQKYWNV